MLLGGGVLADKVTLDEVKAVNDEIKNMIESGAGSTAQHGYAEFTTAGTHTWTCPTGVSEINVILVSGSGGGGANGVWGNWSGNTGGGGGAAGNIWVGKVFVESGKTYNLIVGSGGTGGQSMGANGANGGSSKFDDIVTLIGGTGGNCGLSLTTQAIPENSGDGGVNDKTLVMNNIGFKAETRVLVLGANGETLTGSSMGANGGSATMLEEIFLGVASPAGGKGGNNTYNTTVLNKGTSGSSGKIILIW